MKTTDFDYDLPEELIAQHPEEKRDHSRLLVLNRDDNSIKDEYFYNLGEYLKPGDLLVVNNTKVIPARLFGRKKVTHGKVEILLLKRLHGDTWECMVRPGRRLHVGDEIEFSPNLSAVITGRNEEGLREVTFEYDGVFEEILSELGEVPLPPYIHEKLTEQERYQTVYAREDGSAAAPTAGLHFTQDLISELKEKGIDFAKVTLHVGLGTFRPVSEENPLDHPMHEESYEIPSETIEKIKKTKNRGGRVVAVGTTTVRALESAADENGELQEGKNSTRLFIYPGKEFKITDSLITNFHLPKSTLLMLVSAFYDREHILEAYQHAIDEKYRFFSFGDAMLIE